MKKKTKDNSVPSEDIFKKKGAGEGDAKTSSSQAPVMPPEKEFAEAHTPELSIDTFQIADKTFQLRASNIKTQKIMAYSLDVITDLIKKIDLLPIFKGLQEKLNLNQAKMIAKIRKAEKNDDVIISDDSNDYLDMVELVRDVISHGGIGNIVNTILDLYVGVIFAVCKSQDETVSRDWIEEKMSFYELQRIFFIQMNKDRLGGRVIDFLHMLTQQIVSGVEKTD